MSGSVRLPAIRKGEYKLVGDELYQITRDPGEQHDIVASHPEIVTELRERLVQIGNERPPRPDWKLLMTPAFPWVYGQKENARVPEWVKEHLRPIRARQPQSWAAGTTPWPQAPKDGKIIYSGDGR